LPHYHQKLSLHNDRNSSCGLRVQYFPVRPSGALRTWYWVMDYCYMFQVSGCGLNNTGSWSSVTCSRLRVARYGLQFIGTRNFELRTFS
jgi:hypothetical protein